MTARRSNFARSGFTLLELLIVGMVGIIVMSVITNVWRWYGYSMTQQQIDVAMSQELKIAAEAIAQDYGSAVGSRTLDGAQLQIDLDGGGNDGIADWASPDTVIEYWVDDGKLYRRDVTNGTADVVVAANMDSIAAAVDSGQLNVALTAKMRQRDQTITLKFTGP